MGFLKVALKKSYKILRVSQFSSVELLSIRVVCSKCFAPSLLLRRYFPLVITKYEKCLQHFSGSSHPHQHKPAWKCSTPRAHREQRNTSDKNDCCLQHISLNGEKGLHRFCTHAKLRASGSLLRNGGKNALAVKVKHLKYL
jgi:hypothetical protein